jgi:hypothetical protein
MEEELYNLWREKCVGVRTPRESWAFLHATCETPPNYAQFKQFVDQLRSGGKIDKTARQQMLDGMGVFTLEEENQ